MLKARQHKRKVLIVLVTMTLFHSFGCGKGAETKVAQSRNPPNIVLREFWAAAVNGDTTQVLTVVGPASAFGGFCTEARSPSQASNQAVLPDHIYLESGFPREVSSHEENPFETLTMSGPLKSLAFYLWRTNPPFDRIEVTEIRYGESSAVMEVRVPFLEGKNPEAGVLLFYFTKIDQQWKLVSLANKEVLKSVGNGLDERNCSAVD